MKKTASMIAVVALAVVMLAVTPMTAGYTAGTGNEIAEVAAELHPPNEIMRELHPDMYKSPDTIGIYGQNNLVRPKSPGNSRKSH